MKLARPSLIPFLLFILSASGYPLLSGIEEPLSQLNWSIQEGGIPHSRSQFPLKRTLVHPAQRKKRGQGLHGPDEREKSPVSGCRGDTKSGQEVSKSIEASLDRSHSVRMGIELHSKVVELLGRCEIRLLVVHLETQSTREV